MSAPVTPEALATRASALMKRGMREWAASPDVVPILEIPLKPPTERDVLTDVEATVRWIDSWRAAEVSLPVTVTWGRRQWARVGAQAIPERARVEGAHSLALVADATAEWEVMRSRCVDLRAALEPLASSTDPVVAALQRHAGTIASLPPWDFDVLAGVVEWLAQNPVSGMRVRELPIRGIDTKWLERHRGLVEGLVRAVTGRDNLGLTAAPRTVRVRALDAALRIGGLADVTAPVVELASLPVHPRIVLITENLETLLALPDLPGVVAIHGSGYAVDRIAELPWVTSSRVLYWGDLDSHGFAILHRARAAGLDIESVLMDASTLNAHRDLWVPEPQPFTGELTRLTPGESAAFSLLAAEHHPRLEQERIPWSYALDALRSALGEGR